MKMSKEYHRQKYLDKREQVIERSRLYYLANKEKVKITSRKSHLRNTYGLTPEEYLELMVSQQNRCAICRQYEHRVTKTGDIKPLSVDHCHSTGKVRALLCNDCNALLGFASEDIERLENAIIYIKLHR